MLIGEMIICQLLAGYALYIYIYISGAGGGSFKDRKPLGKCGCCDAWLAEQSH